MIELMSLGVQLDVYECITNGRPKYFRRSRDQWESMARDLRTAQISLRIATIHDATFVHAHYNYSVRAHIRCENIGHSSYLPLLPEIERI